MQINGNNDWPSSRHGRSSHNEKTPVGIGEKHFAAPCRG
jgi:hypothetical protein